MQDIKRMSLEATVIRADGTTEDLGIIALYDRDEDVEDVGRIKAYSPLIEELCE